MARAASQGPGAQARERGVVVGWVKQSNTVILSELADQDIYLIDFVLKLW